MEKIPEKRKYRITKIEEIKKRLIEEFDLEKREETKENQESAFSSETMAKGDLEQEVEMLKAGPQTQNDIKEKAQQIKGLDPKGKLKKLLSLTQEKGLSFAVATAKAMNDPYTLDIFHDILIKKGSYKKKE